MRFSEARGRKVVSIATADTVGKVDGFVIDPTARAVCALEVRKTASGSVLPWSGVESFGADAVTVAGAEQITSAAEDLAALMDKDHRVVGKRVLSTRGDDLGKVRDVEFDGESGLLTLLVLDQGEVAGVRLRGVGSYAVVVTAQMTLDQAEPGPS
ncbi:MAG: PRC-barrel domain-containing protein [Pseudonocardia sp.]